MPWELPNAICAVQARLFAQFAVAINWPLTKPALPKENAWLHQRKAQLLLELFKQTSAAGQNGYFQVKVQKFQTDKQFWTEMDIVRTFKCILRQVLG